MQLKTDNPEEIIFTDEEIKSVREAIRKAEADMREWERQSRVTPERMQQKIVTPKMPTRAVIESRDNVFKAVNTWTPKGGVKAEVTSE